MAPSRFFSNGGVCRECASSELGELQIIPDRVHVKNDDPTNAPRSSASSAHSKGSFRSARIRVSRSDLADLFRYGHLDRKLKRHHITGIAFSGTIGIGLFVGTGRILAIAGSGGLVIGFACAGVIVISVMRSLSEMVSVRPVFYGLVDFPHIFVDPALGFATGAIYCLAQCFSMAYLISATAAIPGTLVANNRLEKSQTSGIIIGLSLLTLLGNICGVRFYGDLERIFKWIKLALVVALCVLMIPVKLGVGGYSTMNASRNYTENAFLPGFVPAGLNYTSEMLDHDLGIPGSTGVFLGVWTAITLSVLACMGGDIVIVSAGEAQHPRRDLPTAARFMYLAPIILYILATFLLGFNINYNDPNLSRQWLDPSQAKPGPTSPYIVILAHTTLAPDVLTKVLSALFMFSAWSAANTALFVASRTMFATAHLYGNKLIKGTLGRTNSGHTPIAAILCCSTFSLVAFLGFSSDDFSQPSFIMAAFFVGSVACVYAAECIAFLRFKAGLATSIRDSDKYRNRFDRGHWQPMFAIIGLVGCVLITLFSGWAELYILSSRSGLSTNKDLKPNGKLAWDVAGAYAGPILYIALYVGYKTIFRTRLNTLSSQEVQLAYDLPEFEGDDDDIPDRGRKDWKWWLAEVWSFVK